MKRTRKVRPTIEMLEDRYTPSAAVAVSGGDLLIIGATPNLTITAVTNTTYHVTHDGVTDTATGVTGNIRVKMGNATAGENVTVDLQGHQLANDLLINTGFGPDVISVVHGIVTHDVQVYSGGGADTVTLGDGTNALVIGHDAIVTGGPFANNSLELSKKATVNNNLTTHNELTLALDQGSTVKADVSYFGGSAGYNVNIAGAVTGNVWFFGGTTSGVTAKFTLAATATVGQNVAAFTSSLWPGYLGSSDTFIVDGHVGNNVYLQLGGEQESVTFGPDLVVKGRAWVFFGGDSDTFTYATPSTTPMTAYIAGGFGNNTFNGESLRPKTATRVGFRNINP